jgi:hypothetical protein
MLILSMNIKSGGDLLNSAWALLNFRILFYSVFWTKTV